MDSCLHCQMLCIKPVCDLAKNHLKHQLDVQRDETFVG